MAEQAERDLIIFSNSPGEVSGWVRPFVDTLVSSGKAGLFRTFLIIHPCQFGTGREPFVAASFPGIDHIVPPSRYLAYLLTGSWRRRFGVREEGVIISLGGDLRHPVIFNRRMRLGYRLYAYSDNPNVPGKEGNYERIYVRSGTIRDRYIRKGVQPDRVVVTGDLVYSSVHALKSRGEARHLLGLSEGDTALAVLPGSRDFEMLNLLPVFLKVLKDAGEKFGFLKYFLLKSPYVSYDLIRRAVGPDSGIEGVERISGELRWADAEKVWYVDFGSRSMKVLEEGLEYWGSAFDLALTVAGTNTIQLAYRGVPLLVVTPLNKPEIIPFNGVLALLKWIPLIGKPVLRRAFLRYSRRFKYSALPNIYEDEEVVPELFGVIRTEDITNRLFRLIDSDEPAVIKKRLERFRLESDPAETIVSSVFS